METNTLEEGGLRQCFKRDMADWDPTEKGTASFHEHLWRCGARATTPTKRTGIRFWPWPLKAAGPGGSGTWTRSGSLGCRRSTGGRRNRSLDLGRRGYTYEGEGV